MKEPQPLGTGPSLGWQWKAIIPIVGVLLLGLIAFQAIVVALDIPSRPLDRDRCVWRRAGHLFRDVSRDAGVDSTAARRVKEGHRPGKRR